MAVLGVVVGVPFVVAMALAGPVLLIGWPMTLPIPDDEPRWLVGLGAQVAAAFMLHELVRDLREVPRSRVAVAAVLAGSAVRHRRDHRRIVMAPAGVGDGTW